MQQKTSEETIDRTERKKYILRIKTVSENVLAINRKNVLIVGSYQGKVFLFDLTKMACEFINLASCIFVYFIYVGMNDLTDVSMWLSCISKPQYYGYFIVEITSESMRMNDFCHLQDVGHTLYLFFMCTAHP